MRTKKSWVLSKAQCKMTICKYAKFKRWEIFFLKRFKKKVILTSSFDKNNLGKESFALGKEIHRNKRKKGVSGLSQRAYLEKSSKRYICMRVSLRLSYCQG